MSGVPAYAGDLLGSIDRVAAAEAAQLRPAARAENPYKVGAISLVGGGALLLVGAFVFPSGAKCESDYNLTSVECGTTSNKGLLVTGLAALAGGSALYVIGEGRKVSPQLVIHGGRVSVQKRVSW